MLPVHRLPPASHMDALQHGESCGQRCPPAGPCSRGAAGLPGPLTNRLGARGIRASGSGVSTPACSQGDPAWFYKTAALCRWHSPAPALGAEAEAQARCETMLSWPGSGTVQPHAPRDRWREMPPASPKPRRPLGAQQPLLLRSLPAKSTEGTARCFMGCPSTSVAGTSGEANTFPCAQCRREERQPPRSLAQCYLLLSIY